ncbi:MAG: phosphatidylglycerophosphatase A [Planctomycetota bacterium]
MGRRGPACRGAGGVVRGRFAWSAVAGKPPPIHGLHRAPGGRGILVDDLVAGLYALAVAQIVARFIL